MANSDRDCREVFENYGDRYAKDWHAATRGGMTFLRIVIPPYLLFEHDLSENPVPTFPDHALTRAFSSEVDTGSREKRVKVNDQGGNKADED